MKNSLKYWVWLSSVPKIGSRRGNQLLETFGDPESIWNAKECDLTKLTYLNKPVIEQLLNKQVRDESERHMENLLKFNISVITITESAYPYLLKNIYDPPIALFVLGRLDENENNIAIVGSRRASPYGLSMAEMISQQLAKCNITVVSGMARGIDTYAHFGALKGGGRTIAVLGCGLDIAYPYENKDLMKKIEENGAVISEYLPGMQPLPQNFPARNRIISGLSQGVVVIEANERSGSLITANFALEQGREVFALPGNINNKSSRGANKLIKEGAKLVIDIQDILEELNLEKGTNNNYNNFNEENEIKKLLHKLDTQERKVVECICQQPLHIDEMVRRTELNIQTLNSILVMLELRGIVEQQPGKI
ncbi:MAG: protecting protein DprA, partial [Clostridiales bacterium]|nr:protecting protein DprA [Clostridiales bacterium]